MEVLQTNGTYENRLEITEARKNLPILPHDFLQERLAREVLLRRVPQGPLAQSKR
jgi:hypothetical protein